MSTTQDETLHQGRIIPTVFREDLPVPTAESPVTSLKFEAKLLVNSKEVSINSGDLLNMADKGIEFSLGEDGLDLGHLKDLINWFGKQMGFPEIAWDDLPDQLQAIGNISAFVERLTVKALKQNISFDIAVRLDFGWKLVGELELKSFKFELTRQQVEPPTPPDQG